MEFKIEPIKKDDLCEINKVLIKEIGKSQIKRLKAHLKSRLSFKLIDENSKICAFCLAFDCNTHFSLSYYYVYENHRRKWQSFFFFSYCFLKMKDKSIFVKKNKNYEQYKRYFENTSQKDIIKFKSLREDREWVALLRK